MCGKVSVHTESAYGIVAFSGMVDDLVCTVAMRKRRHVARNDESQVVVKRVFLNRCDSLKHKNLIPLVSSGREQSINDKAGRFVIAMCNN